MRYRRLPSDRTPEAVAANMVGLYRLIISQVDALTTGHDAGRKFGASFERSSRSAMGSAGKILAKGAAGGIAALGGWRLPARLSG